MGPATVTARLTWEYPVPGGRTPLAPTTFTRMNLPASAPVSWYVLRLPPTLATVPPMQLALEQACHW